MNKKEVINEANEKVIIEIIGSFSIEEYGKNYLVYTLNDKGDTNEVTVLLSEFVYQDNIPKLVSIPESEINLVLNFYDNVRDTISGRR